MKTLALALLNGTSAAALYFLVAMGFTLTFGLMRTVNLAYGALYLFGGYVGYFVSDAGGNCCLLYTSPSPRDVEESRMPSSA